MKLMTAPEVVTRKGKPVSVILPIRDYLDLGCSGLGGKRWLDQGVGQRTLKQW